jgi:hypothetical protein
LFLKKTTIVLERLCCCQSTSDGKPSPTIADINEESIDGSTKTFFLREFVGDEHGSEIGDFCDGNSATDGDDSQENMRAFFLPFWPFLIAIYRALGEGENELAASDALWLGLIDTVHADS